METRAGRPPSLNETKREILCALLSVGCSRETAARKVGVSTQTIRNTAQRDLTFAQRLIRCEAEAELAHLKNIRQASNRSWRASAWALERLAPERYGDRRSDVVSPRELMQFLDKLAVILAEEVSDPTIRRRIRGRLENLVNDPSAIRLAERASAVGA